ncbi:MAG: hypothetical protein R6U78_01645 [Bacteroidales bacterium]
MNREQIDQLVENCGFPDQCNDTRVYETHISWVILTDRYAFKVKRPVKYSFLDFSSPDRRKYFCEQEVVLNRRLAPGMYLGVIPITEEMLKGKKNGEEGAGEEQPLEYAVQMKRMDNEKEMDRLLKDGRVESAHLDKLAAKIAGFHRDTRIIKNVFDTTGFQDTFADLLTEGDFIGQTLGDDMAEKVRKCVDHSNAFLNASRNYFNQRIITGFRRDCHGDLNASNIFLYDDPVIFDCIEFNKEFRHIDVLNEIAFLCVDLDFFGDHRMSDHFYDQYLKALGAENNEDSRRLFMYYKSYRANVRAKVTALSAKQKEENSQEMEDLKQYLTMMDRYCREY